MYLTTEFLFLEKWRKDLMVQVIDILNFHIA